MPAVTTRNQQRQGMSTPTRLRLLETDADEQDDRADRLETKFDTIIKLMIGLLVSTTTGAILLAIQTAAG